MKHITQKAVCKSGPKAEWVSLWYVPLKGFDYLFYYSTEKGWWQSVLHSSHGMQPHKAHEGKETPKFGFVLGFLWNRCIGWWKGGRDEWSSGRGYVAGRNKRPFRNTRFPWESRPNTHPLRQNVSIASRAMKDIFRNSNKLVLNQLKISAEIKTAPLRSGKKIPQDSHNDIFKCLNIYLSVGCAGLRQCPSTTDVCGSEDTLWSCFSPSST